MGGYDDRCTVFGSLDQQRDERITTGRIESDKGLVDQEELERTYEPNGKGGLLPQSATEGGGKIVGTMLEAEARQQVPRVVFPVITVMEAGDSCR